MSVYKEMIKRGGGGDSIKEFSAIEVPDSTERFRIFRIMGGIKQGFSNCWVIANAAGEAAVIDPGGKRTLEVVLDLVNNARWEIKLLLATHCHGDHIGAAAKLANAEDIPVHIHPKGTSILKSGTWVIKNTPTSGRLDIPQEIHEIADGDQIPLGQEIIEVVHTPGHTFDSCCFATNGCLFSGDTLFSGKTGRTDFYMGNAGMMRGSLKKLLDLDKDTFVHPGHGDDSSIGKVKKAFTS